MTNSALQTFVQDNFAVIYDQFSKAGKVFEALGAIFDEQYNAENIKTALTVVEGDKILLDDLFSWACEERYQELAKTLGLLKPDQGLAFLLVMAKRALKSELGSFAELCSVPYLEQASFTDEPISDPSVVNATFILAVMTQDLAKIKELLALKPSGFTLNRALILACDYDLHIKSELINLLYTQVESAVFQAITEGDIEAFISLVYFVGDYAKVIPSLIEARKWHFLLPLRQLKFISMEDIQRFCSASLIEEFPDLLNQIDVCVGPSEIDDYEDYEIPASPTFSLDVVKVYQNVTYTKGIFAFKGTSKPIKFAVTKTKKEVVEPEGSTPKPLTLGDFLVTAE